MSINPLAWLSRLMNPPDDGVRVPRDGIHAVVDGDVIHNLPPGNYAVSPACGVRKIYDRHLVPTKGRFLVDHDLVHPIEGGGVVAIVDGNRVVPLSPGQYLVTPEGEIAKRIDIQDEDPIPVAAPVPDLRQSWEQVVAWANARIGLPEAVAPAPPPLPMRVIDNLVIGSDARHVPLDKGLAPAGQSLTPQAAGVVATAADALPDLPPQPSI